MIPHLSCTLPHLIPCARALPTYSPGHVQVVVLNKEPLFFSLRDGQYFPTLRLLHQCTSTMHTRTHVPHLFPQHSWAVGRKRKRILPTHLHTSPLDPGFMPEVQVDRGAIRFVLGGAHIMCPGLTSPGGRMEEELPAETAVVRLCVYGRWTG